MQHSSSFLKLVIDAKSRIKECTVDDIHQMYKSNSLDGLLIDVREGSEFNNGCLPNATHISKGIIECHIEQLVPNKNQKMYLYCGGGFRSALAADLIQIMGYANVNSIAGGFRSWNAKSYPVFKPEDFTSIEYIKLVNKAKSDIKEISATSLHNMYKNNSIDGVVIDIREDSEFTQFHIPNAVHLSKGQIEMKIEGFIPNRNQKIYLYCGSGNRSILTASSLQKMGYTNIISLCGGIKKDWLSNNYPVTQGSNK